MIGTSDDISAVASRREEALDTVRHLDRQSFVFVARQEICGDMMRKFERKARIWRYTQLASAEHDRRI